MRKYVFVILLLSVVLSQCGNRCETAEGPRYSKLRPILNVNHVTLNMVADMLISTDAKRPNELEITTQEGVHEKVNIDYMLGKLDISMDDCVKENEEILFDANLDSIYQITLMSAGSIRSSSAFRGQAFRLTNEGLGDIDFVFTSSSLIAEIKSAGDIILAGATRRIDFLTTASGDLRAYNLVADTVNLNIIGSSVCEVYTDGVLNVHFYTDGVVNYRGNPKEIIVEGEGELKHVEI